MNIKKLTIHYLKNVIYTAITLGLVEIITWLFGKSIFRWMYSVYFESYKLPNLNQTESAILNPVFLIIFALAAWIMAVSVTYDGDADKVTQ